MTTDKSSLIKEIESIINDVPRYSHHGRSSIKFTQRLIPTKKFIKSAVEARKSILNSEEIEKLVNTPQKPHKSLLMKKETKVPSSSFLSVTREKREEIQKSNYSDAPPSTKYSPNYFWVRPRTPTNVQLRETQRSSIPRDPKVFLPDCVDEKDLECKYPHKAERKSELQKTMNLSDFMNSAEIRSCKRKKTSAKYYQSHMAKISFSKQSERKGIPLNQMHESVLDKEPVVKKSESLKAPSFKQYISRQELFNHEIHDGNYHPNHEFLKQSLSKGILPFDKMSSRNSIFDTEYSLPSPDYSAIQNSYERTVPRSRVRTLFIGKRDSYKVYSNSKSISSKSTVNLTKSSSHSISSSNFVVTNFS
ncbi:unnamed protein product [Blepharisma stoltei]|uniref:Uncharacterized protein n=1 Tax=Blepharisma stoltei TaxID=1481888 RepID=A0AAU9JMY0_9CILI|nr:unnamed protein product [Blepharisma stoltei]